MSSNFISISVTILIIVCRVHAIVHETRFDPSPSSNSILKSIEVETNEILGNEADDAAKNEVESKESFIPSKMEKRRNRSQAKSRQGKQFMTILPRLHHHTYPNQHQRMIPLQYRYPYFLMRPTYTGVNRYGIMPGVENKVSNINGEKEKNKENKKSSNESEEKDENDFQVIAESRVRNTLNSIQQDGVLVNKSIIIEEPAQEEQIIGRANYFAHRLAIDAETPLHLQNENTLITNTNNDLNQQDFSIIAATRNITGTRPFDTDLAPDLNNPRDCCLFIFLDGSAFYLDNFLEKLTGFYRLMAGTVNGYPHFVARSCRSPDIYGNSCTYIWYSGYGWVVGVGRYIGQTKGVMYTQNSSFCPTGIDNWRYLNQDLKWMDNGAITVTCAS